MEKWETPSIEVISVADTMYGGSNPRNTDGNYVDDSHIELGS